MKISGIYQIQSKIKPERIYIGSATNINQRWTRHLIMLRNNKHHSPKIQQHFNKYGINDLQFSILLGCKKEDLIKNEQFFIDSYNPWFNICKIAGSNLGRKFSKEVRKKISESHIGLKQSEETIQKRVIVNKGNKYALGNNFKHTKEARKKISESKKGNKNPNYGKHPSEETKKKMSEAHFGMKYKTNKVKL